MLDQIVFNQSGMSYSTSKNRALHRKRANVYICYLFWDSALAIGLEGNNQDSFLIGWKEKEMKFVFNDVELENFSSNWFQKVNLKHNRTPGLLSIIWYPNLFQNEANRYQKVIDRSSQNKLLLWTKTRRKVFFKEILLKILILLCINNINISFSLI